MDGLTGLRGTWVVLVVGATTFLVAQMAFAAPTYPVNNIGDAASSGHEYTVAYDPSTHVLAITDDTVTGTTLPAGPADGTTGSSEVSVEGPNGQVNHGQVVRNSHDLVDGEDRGCVTNAIARSDLGKESQQVKGSDVADGSTTDLVVAIDEVLLSVDCAEGRTGAAGDGSPTGSPEESENKAKGAKATEVGTTAPGNSGNAPGKNK